MISSDACYFRNGKLKQLNDGEGWEKQENFIQAKTLEKFMQTRMKTKQKKNISRKSNPRLTLLYTIFHEKGTPFNTLFRTLYPFWLL